VPLAKHSTTRTALLLLAGALVLIATCFFYPGSAIAGDGGGFPQPEVPPDSSTITPDEPAPATDPTTSGLLTLSLFILLQSGL
jgi:hypothetical protein